MRPDEIKVGGFYVKKDEMLVREILSEETGKVEWLSYNLRDGSSWGDSSICELSHMANWAVREATAEEVARMDRAGAHRKKQEKWDNQTRQLIQLVTPLISDDELLDEVRRRGLTL